MDRIPPHSTEAEKAVLGALLLDGDKFSKVAGLIKPADFYKGAHGHIFTAAETLYRKQEPIDIVTISEALKQAGKMGDSLSLDYLADLANQTATAATIKYHAEIVREKARARDLLRICMENTERLFQGSETKEIISGLRRDVSAVSEGISGNLVNMKDMGHVMAKYIESRVMNKGRLSGLATGFTDLDDIFDGLQAGDSVIIAARPGCGKTALGLAIAQNVTESGIPAGFISLEMGMQSLGLRLVANATGIPMWKIRKGFCSEHFSQIINRLGEMMNQPIQFAFKARNLADIEAAAIAMCEAHVAKLIVLDYLQFAKVPGAESRRVEVGEISRLMKHIANTYEIPVISLAQLNREVEKRENKCPTLADLKESGDIEQDADAVLFLWNTDEEKRQSTVLLNVEIAKGRNYGLGRFQLRWNKETMRFLNISTRGDNA